MASGPAPPLAIPQLTWSSCTSPRSPTQGQASDIAIQAKEILKMRSLLNDLYVQHTGQTQPRIGELESAA